MRHRGKIFDLKNRRFFNGEIEEFGGVITSIVSIEDDCDVYILPGLIDSHVHVESSMLTPSRFAELVVTRGTVAVVADPHEIANVMGVSGIDYMIDDAFSVPVKFFFGAPSCVPASRFDNSGAVLDCRVVERLLLRDDIWFLSEVMNFKGVVDGDEDLLAKIASARKLNKPIDGHAPCLEGDVLRKYCSYSISTDHECSSLYEANLKILYGMQIQIREGSAARNFDSLFTLFNTNPYDTMICTDDSHPDEIIDEGHIDKIIKKGLLKGISIFDLIQAAVINPINHYNIPVGQLRVGDFADFIVVNNLCDFAVQQTFIDGKQVYDGRNVLFETKSVEIVNNFNATFVDENSIKVRVPVDSSFINIIELIDGELLTKKIKVSIIQNNSLFFVSDSERDILKIVVLNRYKQSEPAVAFVRGFGFKKGAIASSIAHDSHNVIAVGVGDFDIVKAINCVIENKGAIVVCNEDNINALPLPIAGIMSDLSGREVAEKYESLNEEVTKNGCSLKAPFMSLSFLSLLVVPELKIGDKGLFDVSNFSYMDLFE